MSYADRAQEHRRRWNQRADTGERLAASYEDQPKVRDFVLKMSREARRYARWPYWLVWSMDRLAHWSVPLLIIVGFWIWWLTDDDFRGWFFWSWATAVTLLMLGIALIRLRLERRQAEERRRFEEWAADQW